MRATGIVRRMDDLGRIVIPKEIRRQMGICEGDPLEIFTEGNAVCLKKYVSFGEKEVIENILTATKGICPKVVGIEYNNELYGVKGKIDLDFEDSYENTLRFWFSAPPALEETSLIQKLIYAFTD